MAAGPEPLTPLWWLLRLHKQLRDRQKAVTLADQWYAGPHPAPRGYEQAREVLARLVDMANANFMALVVDAAVERMHVEGFRINGQVADDPWTIWQSNSFDLGSEMVFVDSLALGEAAVLVDPARNSSGQPTLTPEHPAQTIVAYTPGSFRDRAAGLKVWLDDLQQPAMLMAAVYLPDRVDVFQVRAPTDGAPLPDTPAWEHQESLSGAHDLGEVPLVAFPNRPRMMKSGTPEFDRVVPIQKRINKTLLDRVVLQDFGSFRQKWVTGMEIPIDPDTKQPVQPFKAALDRLFVGEEDTTRFGQFEAENPEPLLAAVDADVKQIAAIVPTPPHYLLGDMVNLSAEALKAAEAALVSRIRHHMRHFEEPLEAVVRLGLRAAGKSSPDGQAMETIWRNPEFRTEGELVDALVKMSTIGVPQEALWERWGATPQEIKRWKTMARQDALIAQTSSVADFINGTSQERRQLQAEGIAPKPGSAPVGGMAANAGPMAPTGGARAAVPGANPAARPGQRPPNGGAVGGAAGR